MNNSAQDLWTEYLTGRSPVAKRALVVQYVDLVRYVVSRFGRPAGVTARVLESDDMLQYGMLGLIDAIDRFRPSVGAKFETYAVQRIRGAILDELRNLDCVPRTVRANIKRVERAVDSVSQEFGREAVEQEIAVKLEMSVDELQKILKDSGIAMNGARPVPVDAESSVECVAEESPGPLDQLSDEEDRSILVEAVNNLPQREKTVIALYYYEGLKFGDIAHILRVSESRVSQIHNEVLRGLRKKLVSMA